MIHLAEWLDTPWLAHVKPWVGLFCLALVLSYWNWKAAVLFCCGILVARLSVHFLPQPIVGVIVGYGLLAAASVFFVDAIAGLVFAVISLLAIVQAFMPVSVLVGEFALIVGMIVCAYDGGSGGLYRRDFSELEGYPDNGRGRLAYHLHRLAMPRLPVEKD